MKNLIQTITQNIQGLTQDNISYLANAINDEEIVNIRIRLSKDSNGSQIDDKYEFEDKTGYRKFSLLVHPDKSICLWRPC